jgi:hypothetical protein
MASSRAIAEMTRTPSAKSQLNIVYGTVSLAINETFQQSELVIVGGKIEDELGLTHDKPLCHYDTGALRNLLMARISEIRDHKPEDLDAVTSIIDAAAASALAKS